MTDLTPRQREVARLVAQGLTDKQIAGRLGMRYNTVRVHVVAIAFSLGIEARNTRVMIARWWMETQREEEVA